MTTTPLDKLKCYALRHKDLLNGYCRGISSNVDNCDFASLDTHYIVRAKFRHCIPVRRVRCSPCQLHTSTAEARS